MLHKERLSVWIFGAAFGAWMGGVYALVTQAINWIYLPNIPLTPPSGTLASYILQYIFLGALIGWISAIPAHRLAGMLLGGSVAAFLIMLLALRGTWGGEFFGATLVLMLFTFLPMIVLMMPIALLVRLGIDAQQIDPDRPYLWARRYMVPALLTILAVILGVLALYPKEQRNAFVYVSDLIERGRQSTSLENLPEQLQDVRGFMENRQGSYQLSWSDRLDTFFGPTPAGSEMSQFLIIARFENDYAFACVFSANRAEPNCADY